MQRATSFGIGLTGMLIGYALFSWIYSMDRNDNAPVAILMGCIFFCPGAILLGRAIWPPDGTA
ncbi:MAG: hypothetical protein ABGZ53_07895 [Fuerstiella sp.]|jgi:hypothetical protein